MRAMAEDIPFDKSFDLVPGQVDEPMPGVRRVLCNNPSPFTFKGTVSYIVGRGQVAIIDPGPRRRGAHRGAARCGARRDRDAHLRHPHPPRSFAGGAGDQGGDRRAGAGRGAAPRRRVRCHVGEAPRLDASNDTDFRPDRALADGEIVQGDGWTIEAVTTPGHTANHMAFAFKEANILFSGDHVMAWSTPVVAPPDGSMGDYMASLQKLAKRTEPIYFPGHGPAVTNAPRFVAAYILHRKAREASILNRLKKGEADIPTLVRSIYIGLDPRLTKAAGLSVLAHLEDLVARGSVATEGPASIAGRYRLAVG